MTILELEHKNDQKRFSAVVRLDYDEIRDLTHGMYYLCEDEMNKRNTSYHETHKEISLLFDLVKNGRLDSYSIDMLCELQKAIEESKSKVL